MVKKTNTHLKTGLLPRTCLPLFVLIGAATLCLAVFGFALVGYLLLNSEQVNNPLVLMRSPSNNQLLEVGQEVRVQAMARDKNQVTRMELWVDGELTHRENSVRSGGISPFPINVSWQPASTGEHTLTVRAFNSLGRRGMATVTVVAQDNLDTDGDHIANVNDRCPEQPGPEFTEGCADSDGDGIPDLEDSCVDTAGLPIAYGCPVPSENDRDGDGVLDISDTCPDEPGSPITDGCPDPDLDGLVGTADLCPEEAGLPENDGCPVDGDSDGDGVPDATDLCPLIPGAIELDGCSDSDGDGVTDAIDACPDEAGVVATEGCPDRDGDGVIDSQDLCPDEPGATDNFGCPFSGAGDADMDGVPDDIDPCADEDGRREDDGCPPPGGEEDTDGDGITDFEEDAGLVIPRALLELMFHLAESYVPVEFQALEFMLNGEYDYVTCYTELNHRGVERWGPFHIGITGLETWPLGDWAALTGNSNTRQLFAPATGALEVYAECAVDDAPPAPGVLPDHYELGSLTQIHPASDWDGRELTVISSGGEGGRSFTAKYRICTPTCEEAVFQPPRLTLVEVSGPGGLLYGQMLTWDWEGDPLLIDGFKLYINGAYVQAFDRRENAYRLTEELAPTCNERLDFTLTAYRGLPLTPEAESPPSNVVEVSGPPCNRNVQVTFERLLLGSNIGSDESNVGHGGNNSQGPIYGSFWAASDSDFEMLEFDAAHCFYWMAVFCNGYYLLPIPHNNVPIMDIFDYIHRSLDYGPGYGMHRFTPTYMTPNRDSVSIQVGIDEPLRIGGLIMDEDWWSGHDTIFNASKVLEPMEIIPGQITLSNSSGNIQLIVQLQISGAP